MPTQASDPSDGAALLTRLPHAIPPISDASQRLRALAALSGSLTDALDPQEATDLVEQKALSALGATSAVVVTLGAFPPPLQPLAGMYGPPQPLRLHVVHAIGLPAEVKAALDELPLDAPVPLAEVAREGAPLFMESERQLQHYPDWGNAMIAAGARSAAIVPVWANGELRGVLGLAWSAPRIFDEDECAFVLTLGTMCAQAIMRAHLKAAERTARADAERANRSKAHFVATISHELRTPINAVLGYTALLEEGVGGPVSAMQKDHLGRMRTSGAHLLGLVEDLLGYARIEAGEEIMRTEPTLLIDVVQESLSLVRPAAEAKGLRIRLDAPDTSIVLYTDRRKLRQIIVNLVANAVKFADTGDVVIAARVAWSGNSAAVLVEVTDAGRGISAEDQAHVFDPFWQKDPSSTHSAGSTGLGLSVARQLARLLGGEVDVRASAIGLGSTFAVTLPTGEATAHAATATPSIVADA